METQNITSQGGAQLLFVTSSVPVVAAVTKVFQKTALLLGSRKLTMEVKSQSERTWLCPSRCEEVQDLASITFTSLLQEHPPHTHTHTGAPHAKPQPPEVLTPNWSSGLWGSAEDSEIPVAPWEHPGSGTGCPGEDRGNLYQTRVM